MGELLNKSHDISLSVNILIKEEDGLFVAHCLELDIVAAAKTLDDAQREIISLICAQIDYAFSNDNLDNLFHPAPKEVWKEFLACEEQLERKYKIEPSFSKGNKKKGSILPPWLIAKTCKASNSMCHA
jgi:hypothetical protein